MPWTSRIDQASRVIYTRVSGALKAGDALAHRTLLLSDRAFDPAYRHVLDLRAVECVDLTTDDIRRLASESILAAPGRQAIVVSNDVLFGLCRMYYAYSSERPGHEEIHVCRSLVSACSRLGIEELPAIEDR